jgi:hypothetical protein
MVEGALVLLTVLFTLLGIVDTGQVLVLHQGLVERVRAGARYGAVNTYDPERIRNVVLYNTASPEEGSRPLLGLTAEMVRVDLRDEGTAEARIEIQVVDYPFRFLTPLIQGVYKTNRIRVSIPAEGMGTAD